MTEDTRIIKNTSKQKYIEIRKKIHLIKNAAVAKYSAKFICQKLVYLFFKKITKCEMHCIHYLFWSNITVILVIIVRG